MALPVKQRQLDIVIVTGRSPQRDISIPVVHVTDHSLDEIITEILKYQSVIIDLDDVSMQKEILLTLRNKISFCLQPIFLTSSIDNFHDSLADGIIEDYAKAYPQALPVLQKIETLDYDYQSVLSAPLFRVLLFQYVRGGHIHPVKDWGTPCLYNYPLVETLSGFPTNVADWLDTQVRRVLLAKGKVIDRVRHCPHCGLANPNYIDVCPSCRSIHIQMDRYLHCFTCGTVQPEKEFITQPGALICPHCNQQLRHIGTDYDRPLENYSCSECQSSFTDPLIIAVCPRCDKVSDPEDLEVRNYTTYSLTEKAVISVKTGKIDEPTALMDDLQNVSYKHFLFQLNWFYEMAQRYSDEQFTIFTIRILNLEELEQGIGTARLLELIEEYVKRVKASLRVTDFTARREKNDLWFLLPKTDISQREIVINRIVQSSEQTQQKQGSFGLKLNIAARTIPEESSKHDSPVKIVAQLTNEIEPG